MTHADIAAYWGAALSTLLGMVQLWGIWSDRFRLDTSYNFCGDPQRGNQILIRNLSGRPIILGHWELLYGSRLWPFRKFEFLQLPGQDEFGDQRIEPQDTLTLTFADEDHFDWGHKTLGGRSIYIRLHFAGRRRSTLRRIYP